MKFYPVIELMDVCYGYRYGWLSKLLEVCDTVMLRPEPRLGDAFRRGLSLRRYIVDVCGVSMDVLRGLRFMLDHGIFVDGTGFAKMFGIDKSPRGVVEVYRVLGVDYGLALDVPSRLHVEVGVEIALSRLLGRAVRSRVLSALHPGMRGCVERFVDVLLTYVETGSVSTGLGSLRRWVYRLLRRCVEGGCPEDLRDALYALSERSVEITLRNLEEQLRFVAGCGAGFRLVPVVQGLFEDHARRCLASVIDLAVGYRELCGGYVYIAIGTGGRVLSTREARAINKLMEFGSAYGKRLGMDVRFHILGWSGPSIAERLRLDLVYSSDSLSARRRAVEGKIYIYTKSGEVRLVHVSSIDPNTWSCPCPVCRDPQLRSYVLHPSGSRRNDARIVHNIWILKQYISALMKRTNRGTQCVASSSEHR